MRRWLHVRLTRGILPKAIRTRLIENSKKPEKYLQDGNILFLNSDGGKKNERNRRAAIDAPGKSRYCNTFTQQPVARI